MVNENLEDSTAQFASVVSNFIEEQKNKDLLDVSIRRLRVTELALISSRRSPGSINWMLLPC